MTLRTARLLTATVPMVSVTLGAPEIAQEVEVLMDSGASYSILSSTVVRNILGDQWRDSLVTTGFLPRFELADGSSSCSIGTVQLPIKFRARDQPVSHSFFVLFSRKPMAILGVNFFMRTGA